MAMAKPPKASQKCASTRRLLCNTADSPLLFCEPQEFRLLDDAHVRPHGLVTRAAIFMTGHGALGWRGETCADHRDVARHQHQIHVRVLDQESMHDISTGGTKCDECVRGNHDALRRERVLLTQNAHGYGAIRFDRAAE